MKRSPLIITGTRASGCEALGSLMRGLKIFTYAYTLVHPERSLEWQDREISELHDQLLLALNSDTQIYQDGANKDRSKERGSCDRTNSDHAFLIAQEYLSKRSSSEHTDQGLFGWCEPRSSILLEFWQSIECETNVIAVYREPWTNTHLLRQIDPENFLSHPQAALDHWLIYNRKILAFKQRHQHKCLLLHASALENELSKVFDWMTLRYSTPLSNHNATIKLKGVDVCGYADWPYEYLYKDVYPDVYDCWLELRLNDDISDGVSRNGFSPKHHLTLAKQNNKPKQLSIIIPTYNQGHFLVDCIASVEQSVMNSEKCSPELIIINDGTNDPVSQEILLSLARIGYHVINTSNRGLSAARNTGVAESCAPFILPLDDDNLLHSGYLESGLRIISENSDIAAVYGDREDFGLVRQTFQPGVVVFDELWTMNVVDACALIRRSWIEECGGYDTTLTALEDWDLWLNILSRNGNLYYLPEICFSYCRRDRSMTSTMQATPGLLSTLVQQIRSRYETYFWPG